MAQTINTNVASLNAQRNLNSSQSSLATSLQRLSSGLRINSAKDDAAGLAISERMGSQIRGLNQAVRNANDGISLAQTAEGALTSMSDNLQRIRELAVQSANATNTSTDRSALDAEVKQLLSEMTRVADQTSFNGLKLLDGSFSGQNFQVGANAAQTIAVSVSDARSSKLGATVSESGPGILSTATLTSAISINGTSITPPAGTTTMSGVIDAINAKTSETGVTAYRASQTSLTVGAVETTGTPGGTLTINGTEITLTNGNTLDETITKINEVLGQTGVQASKSGTDLILKNLTGGDISVKETGSKFGTTIDSTEQTYVAGIQLSTSIGGSITVATGGLGDALKLAGAATTTYKASEISVSTMNKSNDALKTIDYALQQINSARASLGAVQNRFSSVVANLQTSSENLSASRGRIVDADFASETANLTRGQILQQAGTAMLAQANSLPQGVLSLLRG